MNNLKKEKFYCTGCSACANSCPKDAISLEMNEEGFYQYVIDEKKCINCSLCIKVCPKLNLSNKNKKEDIECYAAYSKNEEVLLTSSSGGMFYEIAKIILEDGGLVVGATLSENKVKHIMIDNIEDLKKLQGSKYIQSYIGNIYSQIKEKINNQKVLFVGTPCQCAAVKKIINNDNLIVVDIVCHGVPSYKVFEKSLKDRFNKKISNIVFRNKEKSWTEYSLKYSFKDNADKKIIHYKDEWFMGYLKNIYLMNSCYNCGFNKLPRIGDITLADCWGIENIDKEYFDENNDKGISFVLLNNEKGKKIFERTKNNIIYKKQKLDDYKIFNPRIFNGKYDETMIKNRKKFFENELDISFKKKRYSKKNSEIIINKTKIIIKKFIRK